MATTNKEVYHEGWLIKSPPTKRIWRARWRRRWFTLKQGELPGQFFLEYYTDRKCRKLKGIIDLDQCEQVDAGLRLDRQKEKYAHMFDVKTPTRTYYLAADTEEDMRGWVNCICQVCSLQETQTVDDRPCKQLPFWAPTRSTSNGAAAVMETDVSNETETTMLNHSVVGEAAAVDPSQHHHNSQQAAKRTPPAAYNPYGTYQNEEMMGFRSMDYTNRETIICEAKLGQTVPNAEAYSNLDPTPKNGEPSSSSTMTNGIGTGTASSMGHHMRTQSLNIDHQQQQQQQRGGKKIPENLKLTDRSPSTSAFDSGPEQPSPALSTSSGPYIPISECYSGSPVTPLNSLDPRFYETPRSHTNIGFNLVNNEQPYSPKRNNVGGGPLATGPCSGKSSPSDSESVFTDDEWTAGSPGDGMRGAGGTIDRSTRPSDSSIENDAVGWTYVQRFSKVPNTEEKQQQQQQQQQLKQGQGASAGNAPGAPPRPPKRTSLNLEGIEKTKDIISSDTENVSPAIGPKEASAHIEQFYDIPRSHQHPYTGSSMHLPDGDLLSPLSQCDLVASSTPNLISDFGSGSQCGTLGRPRPHCYTNAAPTKIEGNVFRFDFSEQSDASAPAINRRLKPRSSFDITKSIESVTQGVKQQMSLGGAGTTAPPVPIPNGGSANGGGQSAKSPPTVDRTRKPATPKLSVISPRATSKNEDRLQYLDLDHSNSPQKGSNQNGIYSSGPGSSIAIGGQGASGASAAHGGGGSNGKNHHHQQQNHHHPVASTSSLSHDSTGGHHGGTSSRHHRDGGETGTAKPTIQTSRTPYTTVDFVKTDAFNRVRADSELTRAQSRLKDQTS
ncbi:AGAP005826-PA [Anopheles gambiae str. PEST]|uniref:AGAP005826-PA n=1 Tax=Anopheles gambiae TaxID=7165 RepID=Q7Q6I4_ANOGA|nr:AGAP005826-PA [Anopheles gambiae str. PEST]